MHVLFVDHTSLVSGAQRALLDLLAGLPADVTATVMCPPGQLADAVRDLGVEVVEYSGTSGSLRLHPVRTATAIGEIVASARAIRRAARAAGTDVIHANSLRAGLMAGLARPLGGRPTVVHIHDALPPTPAAAVVRRFLRASADAVITISDYTTENFCGDGSRRDVHMLHNPLDVDRFDPAALSRAQAREALGLDRDAQLVGLVAQITPWKGQELAIEAMARLHERHPGARLLLVGEAKFVDRATRYDNIGYLESLHGLVARQGLEDVVEFWGEREDVPAIMRALDVLVAPSWEEPFGRSIIEAMALETAVVATNVGGPAEYIADGVDGIVCDPRNVTGWADAIDGLLTDPDRRAELARRGSEKARRLFDRRDYVAGVIGVYEGLVGAAPHAAPLRILLVGHQRLIGGAQRSLLELIRVLAPDHEIWLACPPGPLAAAAEAAGARVVSLPESQLTFRLDARQTPRELVRAARARRAVGRHVRQIAPDVVHANSLRAGLLSVGRGATPVVVHCRDLLPTSPTANGVRRLLLRSATLIVAVSRAAAERFAGLNWADREVVVVDNPVDVARFDPARLAPQEARRELGVAGSPVLGMLAQITPWKGQAHAVRVLHALRATHPDAQLVLAGETKFVSAATSFDNRAYERELRALVAELGLEDAVHFVGERNDAERVVAALDVLLVPSTEEPFGRTVIEALAMETPVVATMHGGPAEVIRPGQDGVVLPVDDVEAWADAVRSLLDQPPSDSRAYAVEHFAAERHAAQMLAVYERALDSRRRLRG